MWERSKNIFLKKIERMQSICKSIENAERMISDGEQAKIDKENYMEEFKKLSRQIEEVINGNNENQQA